jgi:hypothetical protein
MCFTVHTDPVNKRILARTGIDASSEQTFDQPGLDTELSPIGEQSLDAIATRPASEGA